MLRIDRLTCFVFEILIMTHFTLYFCTNLEFFIYAASRDDLVAFFDDTCRLADVDLTTSRDFPVHALCFFLNIYHTLLIHGRLLFGAPDEQVDQVLGLTAVSCAVVSPLMRGSRPRYFSFTVDMEIFLHTRQL